MKTGSLILIFVGVLLLGAGCSNTQVLDKQNANLEPTQPQLVKQPLTVLPIAKAYQFCESQGNHVAMRYDYQTQRPIISCVFSNNTQCEVLNYLYGDCGPDKKGQLTPDKLNQELTDLRYCDKTSPVVCGNDGNNYTNYCIADQQHIPILHEGLCTDEEQSETLMPANPTTITSNSTNQGQSELSKNQAEAGVSPQIEINTGEYAVWLSTLFDVIETTEPKNPRSLVEKCNLGNNGTFYYYKESCEDCFSILYENDGDVSCFPNNDITNACGAFKRTSRSTYCKQIWKDKR